MQCTVSTSWVTFIFVIDTAGTSSIKFRLIPFEDNSGTDPDVWSNVGLSGGTSIGNWKIADCGFDAVSIRIGDPSLNTVVAVSDSCETWLGSTVVKLSSILGRFGGDVDWIIIGSVVNENTWTAESFFCFANSLSVTADTDCIWGPIKGTSTAENIEILKYLNDAVEICFQEVSNYFIYNFLLLALLSWLFNWFIGKKWLGLSITVSLITRISKERN